MELLVAAIDRARRSPGDPMACALTAVIAIAIATLLRAAASPLGDVAPFAFYFPAVFATALVCGPYTGCGAAALACAVSTALFVDPSRWAGPNSRAMAFNIFAFLVVCFLLCAMAGALRRALREREQAIGSLDSLLRHAPLGFAFFDREYRYVRINDILAEINGVPASQHIGRRLRDVLPINARVVEPILERVFATGQAVTDLEVEGETPAQPGVRRFWLTGFYPVDSAGTARLVGAIVLEITDRRRAELALAELNSELEHRVVQRTLDLELEVQQRLRAEAALRQAQKMEAVGQLTGGIAHDFNNLLTVIMGNVDILLRQLPESDVRLRRAGLHCLDAAKRAASLTHRLLAFSRRQALDPKPLDANKLVAGMSELLRRTLTEQVEIETVLAAGLWRCLADPNQLESALLNLAVNARDAMPEGGRLTVETANAFLDERYAAAHDEVCAGQYVVISVTDTGTGMDAVTAERAFEPFFTTKEPGRGTGLGLSQVYGFAKQSDGHVKIYTEPGQGTTVKLYLPRVSGPVSDADPQGESVNVSPAQTGECVLVVEDDENVRAYSADVIGELGYRVIAVADADAALAALASHPDIALLFTDVGLPGPRNGRALADEARRRRPGLHVVFTSGYARNAIVHGGRLDPGVILISKPFTRAELAVRLREAFDGP